MRLKLLSLSLVFLTLGYITFWRIAASDSPTSAQHASRSPSDTTLSSQQSATATISSPDLDSHYRPSTLDWSPATPANSAEPTDSDLIRRLKLKRILAVATAVSADGSLHERILGEIEGRYPRIVVHRESAPDGILRRELAYVADHLLVQLPSSADATNIADRLRALGATALVPLGQNGLHRILLSDSNLSTVDDTLRVFQTDPALVSLVVEPDFLFTTSEVLDATQVIPQADGHGLIDPVSQSWVIPDRATSEISPSYGPDALAARTAEALAGLPEGSRILQFEITAASNDYRPGILLQNFWTRTVSTSDISSVYIQNAYTSGYPLNGGSYVRVLGADEGLIFAHKDGLPFQVHQIDISEYSTVFPYPKSITFTGTKADSSTVSHTFVTDGVIDGTGTKVDFQTFTFPESFQNLVSLRASNPSYMIDNIVVTLAGQETPLPPPPAEPVVYEVNWNEADAVVDAPPPVSGPYAIASINFGAPKVRSAVGALTDKPLEIVGGGLVSYGQIRFDLNLNAERYVLEADLLRQNPSNPLALFFDGVNGLVRIDFNSSTITVMNTSVNVPYTPTQINRIRAEIEPATRKLTLSLNGVAVVNLGSIHDIQDVRAIRFSLTDPSATGGTAIDNLRIEAHAPATPPISAPQLIFFPSETLIMPSVSVGGEITRFVTLKNSGTADLIVSSITTTNPAFTTSSAPIPVIPPGGSFYVNIAFRPTSAGLITGQLQIQSNLPDTPITGLNLQGTALGVPSASLSPGRLEASIIAGTRGTETFQILNTGNAPLTWRLVRTDSDGAPLPPPMATNDPSLSSLWGLGLSEHGGINATRVWTTTSGSPSDIIAVIDTGVDLTHPDLVNNLALNSAEIPGNGIDDDNNGFVDDIHGWDFSDNDNQPSDPHGHGTHVAGTIAATGNNSTGVVGVAWNARVLPIRFLGATGVGYTSDAIQAVDYARAAGARMINASWGGGGFSSLLHASIGQFLSTSDGLFIAAAGNSSADNDAAPAYPSSYAHPGIVSVAASTSNDTLAGFSNFGRTSVDVAAPGSSILSCYRAGGYAYLSGTSMAAPHVTGALALLHDRNPSLSGLDHKTLLTDYADFPPALNNRTASDGRVNIWRSLNRTVQPWVAPSVTFGTVPPGGAVLVPLSIDATALPLGIHTANLAFQTNDPVRSLVALPIRLTVEPGTSFNHWTRQSFAEADLLHSSASLLWSADADPDHDNVSNLLEYLLARLPSIAETSMPLAVQIDNDGAPYVTLELLTNHDGVHWQVEWSATLAPDSWSVDNLAVEEVARDTAKGTRTLKIQFTEEATLPSRVFFRLRAAPDL